MAEKFMKLASQNNVNFGVFTQKGWRILVSMLESLQRGSDIEENLSQKFITLVGSYVKVGE